MLCFIFGNFAVVDPGRMDGQGLRKGTEMGWGLGSPAVLQAGGFWWTRW